MVVAVIVVDLTISPIAASGVGVAMAIILFLREQIGGSVVRHKFYVKPDVVKLAPPGSETHTRLRRSGGHFRTAGQPLLRHPHNCWDCFPLK
ncbi:MAG: hypothetical protein IPL05_20855 [Betaproteobacteria bacterium]|nr:hypothetical protein [Betaproteobacteria bacterium]